MSALPPLIVLATNNSGKVREMNQILREWNAEVRAQSEFNVPAAEETGATFIENALIKARNAANHTHLPAIADDSGLEVDYLNGEPGIYSARYAGPNATDTDNINKLLSALRQAPDNKRTARFVCAMAYMRHARDPVPIIYQATWEGRILPTPQGTHGFGYDPVFWVAEHQCSAAALPPVTKSRISHRGQALRGLIHALQREITPA